MHRGEPGRPLQRSVLRENRLEGLIEFGDGKQALRLCSELLKDDQLDGDLLRAVVRAVAMHGTLKTWAKRLEATYMEYPKRRRRTFDGSMLMFYGAFNDWGNAVRFADARKTWYPDEAAFAMEALLRNDRMAQARRLFGICWSRYHDTFHGASDSVDYEVGFLFHACALYRSKIGDLVFADEVWACIPEDHPLGMIALFNRIDLRLMGALQLVETGVFACANQIKGDPTMLSLPKNHDALHQEHMRNLLRYRRTVSRLLSPERQKEFGAF